MIKLEKNDKPQVLIDNEENWTQELVEADQNGEDLSSHKKRRYAHPEIRSALVEETYEKCAYCESKLTHIVAGDIEHITPKSKRINLTYSWPNLTLACPKCNNAKNDYYDEDEALVDPYNYEPNIEFDSSGTYIFEKRGRYTAGLTINILKLNRPELMERRKEKLDYLRGLLNDQIEVTDVNKTRLIGQMIEEMISPNYEYSFILDNFKQQYENG